MFLGIYPEFDPTSIVKIYYWRNRATRWPKLLKDLYSGSDNEVTMGNVVDVDSDEDPQHVTVDDETRKALLPDAKGRSATKKVVASVKSKSNKPSASTPKTKSDKPSDSTAPRVPMGSHVTGGKVFLIPNNAAGRVSTGKVSKTPSRTNSRRKKRADSDTK
ncbi:MAG: hypothetical protein L6R41_007582 [Letrouitia leprolyta]|nr:MAG: hypothetical protein L6R41_007582 [Letrouitia leprolyta]